MNQPSLLLWATMAALLSQNLVIPVISATAATVEEQKNYYPPDPNAGTPSTPSGSPSYTPPKSSGSGGHGHGHGHGSYGGTPPTNCGNPPSSGGHHSSPTPSTPSGGGGYHYSPPTTPTPSVPAPFFTPPTPTTPIVTPVTPTVPGITIPSPPFDPNSPPFTCNYWRNHPTLIWGILGWFGTVGGTLGATSVPGFGSNTSLMDALANSRTDGYGALYREGTAAFLNSMVSRGNFPFSTQQVRDRFVSSLASNKAAANQARLFKVANEGRAKP